MLNLLLLQNPQIVASSYWIIYFLSHHHEKLVWRLIASKKCTLSWLYEYNLVSISHDALQRVQFGYKINAWITWNKALFMSSCETQSIPVSSLCNYSSVNLKQKLFLISNVSRNKVWYLSVMWPFLEMTTSAPVISSLFFNLNQTTKAHKIYLSECILGLTFLGLVFLHSISLFRYRLKVLSRRP